MRANNLVQGPASISELARALKNNADLIYEYVCNQVDFEFTWGASKGALGTATDGSGNSFDQSMLMVALLMEAGYTANYVLGNIQLPAASLGAWLNTTHLDQGNFDYLLSNGAIPHSFYYDEDDNLFVNMGHVWVQVEIEGTYYMWDTSYKTYNVTTPPSGLSDLATVMGYTQSGFLSDVESGATIAPDGSSISGFNRANLQSEMTIYASNLISYMRDNAYSTSDPTWTMERVIGGRDLVQVTSPNRDTSLPYEMPDDTQTIWSGTSGVPNDYRTTVEIILSALSLDETLYSDDIYGHRLTITFNGSNEPILMLDGVQQGSAGSAATPGDFNQVETIVTHNAHGLEGITWTTTDTYNEIFTGGTFLIANGFGSTSRGMASFHQFLWNQAISQGFSSSSELVLGESLAVLWYSHRGANCRVADILDQLYTTITQMHHIVGIVGYDTTTYYFDVGGAMEVVSTLDGDTDTASAVSTAYAIIGNANEAGALQNITGVESVAEPQVLDANVAANYPIYRVTASNWSMIQTEITNYDSDDITDITDDWFYSGSTWTMLLPGNGNTGIGAAWQGYGLEAWDGPEDMYGELETKIKGGILTGPGTPKPNNQEPPDVFIGAVQGDPVDMATGNYLYAHEDIVVGSGGFPYALNLQRSYSSGNRFSNGPLGLGWTHSFNITAIQNSDAFLALGERSPLEAAGTIAAAYVIVDLFTDTSRGISNVLSTALIPAWLVQTQWWKNTVIVALPRINQTFTLLADGSFNPPLANANSLILESSEYTLVTPQQVYFNFNTDGTLGSMVYPSGVTISLSYSSGVLQSVSNGMGRTLTFSYVSGYLNSVSDGNGRSVSYSINSSGNLVTYTDELLNDRTYSYDPDNPGLLTQWFKPANPTTAVVTNSYDSLSRIETQSNARSQLWTYYLAGCRAEEQDPFEQSHVLYFNTMRSVICDINALGQEIDTVYDGLARPVMVTLPEGNSVQSSFDSKNNVLSIIAIPKPGSGLSNLTVNLTYDTAYNKLHTFEDGNGNITTYNFDSLTGNLLNIQRPEIGGDTPTVTMTYNARGQMLTCEDETGIVTKFTYDADTETLLSIISDYGSGSHLNLTAGFGYDAVGNKTSITDPNSNTIFFQFDNMRRLTQRTTPLPFSYVTNLTYDANSNLTSIAQQAGVSSWQTYSLVYSLTDKFVTLIDPTNRAYSWTYDAKDRVQTYTDAANHEWEYTYDAVDRLYTITDPTSTISRTQSYNDNGTIQQVTDARSNTTVFSYDGFDRPYRTTYQDSSYEEIESYDANCNVLTYLTRSGNSVTNTFDVLNRLSTRAPLGQAEVTYGYDLAGRLTSLSTPTAAGNPASGTFQYQFDSAGRFYQETTPDGKSVTYQFDANGNVTQLTYPDGYYVTRIFDSLNRLTDIKLNGASTVAAHFDYDQLSRRSKLTFGNGAVVNYTYELNDDLVGLWQDFNSTTSLGLAYSYNNVHQETTRSTTDPSYFWHPSAGGTLSYGIANSINQYSTVGAASYSYDGNGNLTGDGTWTYSYDTENHLLSAVSTGVNASYVYDGRHRQIQKTVGTNKTRYVYAGFQRLADYDGVSGSLENRYVYGTGLDEPLIVVSSAGVLSYVHADRQGSTICTTDTSGTVSNKNTYGPFGEGPALTGTTFGFTGQRFDSETGLYYFSVRPVG